MNLPQQTEIDWFQEARRVLQSAQRVVVLTGAGISAGSGVPISQVNHSSVSFLTTTTTESFVRDPRTVWKQHKELRQRLTDRKPNAAHLALVEWFAKKPHLLFTQNIDGLHEASGHPRVRALHGTLWANRCTACGNVRPDRNAAYNGLTYSRCCGALERPHIVWVGDFLNDTDLDAAKMAVELCDVLLVIGTSGTVAPVSRFARRVMDCKRIVIEVNPEPSGFVPSTICIEQAAEDALPSLLR